MGHNVGSIIFFSSFGHMYDGTVIETEGLFVRLRTKCPGTEWIMSKKRLRQGRNYWNLNVTAWIITGQGSSAHCVLPHSWK